MIQQQSVKAHLKKNKKKTAVLSNHWYLKLLQGQLWALVYFLVKEGL